MNDCPDKGPLYQHIDRLEKRVRELTLSNITRLTQLHEVVEIHYYVDHYAAQMWVQDGQRKAVEGVDKDAASALVDLDAKLEDVQLSELRRMG